MFKPFVSFLLLFVVVVYWLSSSPARADSADIITGYSFAGHCYSNLTDANNAYFFAEKPLTYVVASTEYIVEYVYSGGAWYQATYESTTGGAWSLMSSVPVVVTPAFPSCSFDPDMQPDVVAYQQAQQIAGIASSVTAVNASMNTVAAAASSVAASVADSATFDINNALAAFAFFFSSVILLFMVSNSVGEIVRLIRGGGR